MIISFDKFKLRILKANRTVRLLLFNAIDFVIDFDIAIAVIAIAIGVAFFI